MDTQSTILYSVVLQKIICDPGFDIVWLAVTNVSEEPAVSTSRADVSALEMWFTAWER
jgi:hypothetical protein